MSYQFKKYGTWALVVGSADGLGEAYSILLAEKGVNLVMVDRQSEKMSSLAEKLVKEFSIQTICLAVDLSENEVSEKIMNSIENIDCRLMLYVAAYSHVKPFFSNSVEDIDQYMNINCGNLTKLVLSFSLKLKAKGGGGILLMSSLSGLIGMQLITPYAATKAYIWNLAEALHFELKPYNIDVMACVAGPISTAAYLSSNPADIRFKPKVMSPQDVAKAALQKIGKQALFIPGFSNRLNYFILLKILPRKIASSIANKMMLKIYSDKAR